MSTRNPNRRAAATAAIAFGVLVILAVLTKTTPLPSHHSKTALSGFLAPETIQALTKDEQLRKGCLAVLDFSAGISRTLGAQYAIPQLEQSAKFLETYQNSLLPEEGRANIIVQPLRKRLFGLGSNDDDDDATTTDSNSTSTSFLSGLASSISSAFSGIGDALTGDLASPAMFLGVGVGQGAAQGLNWTTAEEAKAVASQVITNNDMKSTGLNPAIQNLGMGLSAALAGSVNTTSLFSSIKSDSSSSSSASSSSSSSSFDLQAIVLAAAEGIGNGTASGFQLSQSAASLEPPTGSDLPTLAGTLTFGLTKTLASSFNLSSLSSTTGLKKRLDVGSLTSNLGAAALSFGQGLGNGTAAGLKLSTSATTDSGPDTNSSDLVAIAGNFAFGLSKSLAENINISALTGGSGSSSGNGSSSSSSSTDTLLTYLPSAASGLGKGLGEGISVGLGLKSDAATTAVSAGSSMDDVVSGVAENFAMSLASSLLANGTITDLLSSSSSSGSSNSSSSILSTDTSSIDVGKVAQGLAVGLIQGTGDAVVAMGGIEALMNGTAVVPTTDELSSQSLTFNDSVDGAATGFGLGLGGQGALVAQMLVAQMTSGESVATTASVSTSSTSATAAVRKRSASTVSDFAPAIIQKRETSSSTGLNLSLVFTADTVSALAQKGVDALTCEGVGGLFAVFEGLQKSGVISKSSSGSGNSTSILTGVIPTGVISISSSGNTYSFEGSSSVSSITINGNTTTKFLIFLAVHVLLALIIFLNALPAVIGLESARNILIRLKLSHIMPNIPRWTNVFWLVVFAPLSILILIFGVLTMGNSAHFRTAHGVLGLITVLISIPACVLHFMVRTRIPEDGMIIAKPFKLLDLRTIRTIINQVLLTLSIITAMTGFSDVSSITMCATQVISFETIITVGFGLAGTFTLGSAISGLDLTLSIRECRNWKKAASKSDLS